MRQVWHNLETTSDNFEKTVDHTVNTGGAYLCPVGNLWPFLLTGDCPITLITSDIQTLNSPLAGASE